MKSIPVWGLLLAFVISHMPAASGQERDRSQEGVGEVYVFMELDYIQLSFLVRDADGNFVDDLSVDDFALFENGKRQRIASLEQEEVPISAVILVDTSYSIRPFLHKAVKTALELFRNLESEHTAIAVFSGAPKLILDWEEMPLHLDSRLNGVRADGQTTLYDSVIWAAESLFQGQSRKRLIVPVTDGIDTASRSTFEDMMGATREHGVILYPIIYTNEVIQRYRHRLRRDGFLQTGVSKEFHKLVAAQNQFVDESMRYGGRTIFSDRFSDLETIYSDIVREMKSHYIMLYESDPDAEGEARDLEVRTNEGPGRVFIEVRE